MNSKKDPNVVSLEDDEGVKEIVIESVLGLWKIVNNLTRLRPKKRARYRVTIFGSARSKPGSLPYQDVKKIAKALGEMGCDVVTGGGPGLMQAANEGVAESGAEKRGQSIGIRVDLPFEQEVNPFVDEAYEHQTFFTRLHHFVLTSDAFVIVPGGIGTTLEAMMVWQLLQVGHIKDVPLIFVGKMWVDFLQWSKQSFLREGAPLANSEDLAIPQCALSAEEVILLLKQYQADWLKKT